MDILLEKVLRLKRSNLINFLSESLNDRDMEVKTDGENYIIGLEGDNLPFLLAHVDTVFEDENDDWECRTLEIKDNIVSCSSGEGLGADDRAGVYTILKAFDLNLAFNVAFFNYEECGLKGVRQAFNAFSDIFKNANYFIEYDRRGENDVVDYLHRNDKKFMNVFRKFYEDRKGTNSDVRFLMQQTEIAGVNLSTGYYKSHTPNEYLNIEVIKTNLDKLPEIINQLGNKRYYLTKKDVS